MARDDGKLRSEIRKGSERFMIEVLEDGAVKSTPPFPDEGIAEKFMATLRGNPAVVRPSRDDHGQGKRFAPGSSVGYHLLRYVASARLRPAPLYQFGFQ